MEGNYPITQVGEVAVSISETHKFGKEQLVFLNTSDILHGKFLHRTYSAVRDWPGQAKKSIRKNDILFSEIRPANGRWAYVDEDADDFVVSTKLMVIRGKQDRLFPKFLYLFLTSSEIAKWLQHLAESRSGTFPQITFDQIATLEIPLPPLSQQKRIAHILGTLDDKIELNRRMNGTLEAMAQAIFKSWFVDFEPVKAKAEAKAQWEDDHPGQFIDLSTEASAKAKALERAAMVAIAGKTEAELAQLSEAQQQSLAQTAALFPDNFQDSELGEIPEGWKVSVIGDETEIVGGGTPSTKNPEFWEEGEYHWVTPKDFSSLQDKILLSSSRMVTEAGLNKISSGLLPAGTVLMSSRAPVGYLAISKIETAINQGFIAMKCTGRISAEYVLQWANSEMDNIKQASSGSTFAEISKKTFRPFSIIVPNSGAIDSFSALTRSFYDQITTNGQESETLAELRDTLLPRLLSGEIQMEGCENE